MELAARLRGSAPPGELWYGCCFRMLLIALGFAVGCSQKLSGLDEEKLRDELVASQPASVGGSHQAATAPAPTADAETLQMRLERVLQDNLSHRLLSSESNAAWQIMHGVIAYADALPLQVGQERRSALDYLFHQGVVQGWELAPGDTLPTTGRQGLKAKLEPGSYIGQGHVDQWLAILAQIGVPLTREVEARGKTFTVLDWARQAQWDVSDNPVLEYSWTIIALTRYFPEEQSWVAKDGKTWTLEPLAGFEAKQDLGQSPCGGMHRLMGLAHAVQFRQKHGGSLEGGWKLADDKIRDSIERIQRFQNPDGTFSTNHTQRPGTSSDLSAVISSTGHTIEFLSFALPAEKLAEPWLVRAVERLCKLLELTRSADLDCGGLYHALNGLKLYYSRRFAPWQPSEQLALHVVE
jgi:hypothetical protein